MLRRWTETVPALQKHWLCNCAVSTVTVYLRATLLLHCHRQLPQGKLLECCNHCFTLQSSGSSVLLMRRPSRSTKNNTIFCSEHQMCQRRTIRLLRIYCFMMTTTFTLNDANSDIRQDKADATLHHLHKTFLYCIYNYNTLGSCMQQCGDYCSVYAVYISLWHYATWTWFRLVRNTHVNNNIPQTDYNNTHPSIFSRRPLYNSKQLNDNPITNSEKP